MPILKMSKTLRVMLRGYVAKESRAIFSIELVAGQGEQARIASDGRRVDGHSLLRGEAVQVVRSARLRAGAREPGAAEGLHPHHGANHVPVHVDIADASS